MLELIMKVAIYGMLIGLGAYFVCAFLWYVIVPGCRHTSMQKRMEDLKHKYGLETHEEFKNKSVPHIVIYTGYGVYRYMGDETSLNKLRAELTVGKNQLSAKVMI